MAGPALGTWEQLPRTPLSLRSGLPDTGPQAPRSVTMSRGRAVTGWEEAEPGGPTQKLAEVQPSRQVKPEPPREGAVPSSHCPHLLQGSYKGHPWPPAPGSRHHLSAPFPPGLDAIRSTVWHRATWQLGLLIITGLCQRLAVIC